MTVRKSPMLRRLEKVCKLAEVRLVHNAGHSTEEIAKTAGVSTSTVRRWLRTTGVQK